MLLALSIEQKKDKKTKESNKKMSNSKLATYTKISSHSTPRNHKIDKITIHHMAGNLSVETCGQAFCGNREVSSNYGIGTDGRIALYVDEKNRAWSTTNPENDHRAINIEVANDGGAPIWHVSDKALEATIALCVDICQRNGMPGLTYTGDKNGTLTLHKYFKATACPGPYLESKMPYIAQEVNRRLEQAKAGTTGGTAGSVLYRVQVGAFANVKNADAMLAKVKAAGFAAVLAKEDNLYKVQVGAFAERKNAEGLLAKVKAAGFVGIISETAKAQKSLAEVAKEVIAGNWGNGLERKANLTAAGYDYDAVQMAVNRLCK